jgi:hypothetical protein
MSYSEFIQFIQTRGYKEKDIYDDFNETENHIGKLFTLSDPLDKIHYSEIRFTLSKNIQEDSRSSNKIFWFNFNRQYLFEKAKTDLIRNQFKMFKQDTRTGTDLIFKKENIKITLTDDPAQNGLISSERYQLFMEIN